MSLPTTSKPSQLSIRSFFQAQPPKYTQPPQPQPQPPQQPPQHSSSSSSSSSPSPPGAIHPPPPSHSAPPQLLTHHEPPAPTLSPASNSTSININNTINASIPPEAAIRPIHPDDVPALRRLNALLLPVSYNDAFYQRAADPSAGRFSRLITWSHSDPAAGPPTVVGAIVCRVEPDNPILPSLASLPPSTSSTPSPTASPPTGPAQSTLYIQSLCLLAPYRSMGLAAAALDAVAAAAAADPSAPVSSVTAHVWTHNDDGLRWYEARGFRRAGEPIRGYYLKLRPDSAWLVSRPLGPSALLRGNNNNTINTFTTNTITNTTNTATNTTSTITNTTNAATNTTATNTTTATAPPRPGIAPSRSYQSQRPDTEWNDLPDDMAPGLLAPAKRAGTSAGGSEATSSASSRSSSAARKKRDRAYPVAAFGNS